MEDRYLFKAKRTDNGEWVIGNLITNVFFRLGQSIPYILCPDKAEYDCFEDFTEENGIFEVDPSTICQCTGLKDKNGKLIWENDILHNGNYFVVKWNLSCARFDFALNNSHNIPVGRWEPMIIDWKNSDFKEYRNNIDFEVIGNIFDNPELLESEE